MGNKYLAFFEENNKTTRALFAKNGYVFHAITYSTVSDLPAAERKLVESNYKNYTIGCVQNVYTQNQNLWVVNLQRNDHLVVVAAADRGLHVLFDNKLLPVFNSSKKEKAKP